MERLLLKKEVAESLRISERQVDYYREAGMLPCVKLGRSVRFRSEVVEKLLNRLTVSTEQLSATKGGNTNG